ncbi:Cellulase [Thermaerobacter marianensis DSM 12885]|uniref:Cellulase n=1 Tax=Thermaerobacter marianensis (strain ATCC 700841 / DSM 12885 / JCM 10246 / 7p75a) TaxID=644966 RepID=E6SJV3_THEM7|nr:M42 family metallopeptidase [Thermaerobacter marianensis]ADU52186.1 Cellulase [Thermaerobacter marianensis DSM 12885]
MTTDWALLRELTEAPGVSGYEAPVREVLSRYLGTLAPRLGTDNLGSLIAERPGAAARPRVMLAAHMDEIGFMVSHIDDGGFVRFQPIGGWWSQVMLAQRVRIYTARGPVTGIIAAKPPHILPADERSRPVDIRDMFVDVGATSRQEAEALGIRPGDPVVPASAFEPLGPPGAFLAKAWDNRAGCVVLVEVLRRLAAVQHPNAVYAVATVQEEVGLRGATTSVRAVAPDVALVIDTTVATDTPGIDRSRLPASCRLGGGPAVSLYDASMIPHLRLRDLVVDTARDHGIPLQFDVMPGGGTDAGKIHTASTGVPTLSIGIPVRYIHSHGSILRLSDLEHAARLIVAVIQRLDAATVDALKAMAPARAAAGPARAWTMPGVGVTAPGAVPGTGPVAPPGMAPPGMPPALGMPPAAGSPGTGAGTGFVPAAASWSDGTAARDPWGAGGSAWGQAGYPWGPAGVAAPH